jgi:phospho-N-acetylmuramoyl-pentapeptide-transferase
VRAILLAGGLSLVLTIIGTRIAIRVFAARGYGQLIRDDGPTSHHTKRGTPTMGGIVIVLATIVAYFLAKLITGSQPSLSALLLLALYAGLGTVGFLDDFIKIYKQRNLGLRSKAKFIGQTVIAVIFGWLVLWKHAPFEDSRGLTPAGHAISFTRDVHQFALPTAALVVFIVLLISGASNAVNLTDGLDGLAAGAAAMVFGAFTLIAFLQFRNPCDPTFHHGCYQVRDSLDIALVAASAMSACFGFLWWNAPPAQIFMGDTGSLALGGLMAGLAILTRTELLLVALGGLFAAITVSSIMQTAWFKFTRVRTGTGRRIFRMAPLHHHFELAGWEQVTIIVRFWIMGGMAVAFGMGLFYADFIGNG